MGWQQYILKLTALQHRSRMEPQRQLSLLTFNSLTQPATPRVGAGAMLRGVGLGEGRGLTTSMIAHAVGTSTEQVNSGARAWRYQPVA